MDNSENPRVNPYLAVILSAAAMSFGSIPIAPTIYFLGSYWGTRLTAFNTKQPGRTPT